MLRKPNVLLAFEQSLKATPSHYERTHPIAHDVSTFMEACGHLPSHTLNKTFDPLTFALYMRFVREEYKETIDALEEFFAEPTFEKLSKVIDGLFDLTWVAQGAQHTTGLPHKLTWLMGAHSNLCKIDPTTGEVNKDENGKIMKPAGWQKPAFFDVVANCISHYEYKDVISARELWNRPEKKQ